MGLVGCFQRGLTVVWQSLCFLVLGKLPAGCYFMVSGVSVFEKTLYSGSYMLGMQLSPKP